MDKEKLNYDVPVSTLLTTVATEQDYEDVVAIVTDEIVKAYVSGNYEVIRHKDVDEVKNSIVNPEMVDGNFVDMIQVKVLKELSQGRWDKISYLFTTRAFDEDKLRSMLFYSLLDSFNFGNGLVVIQSVTDDSGKDSERTRNLTYVDIESVKHAGQTVALAMLQVVMNDKYKDYKHEVEKRGSKITGIQLSKED